MKRLFSLMVLAPLLTVAAFAEEAAEKPTNPLPEPTLANVPYGPNVRHVFDLWSANRADGKPTPLVVFIHGGGWAGGDKSTLKAGFLKQMLKQGISVASINYRYTPKDALPAPVHDAARAIQVLRSRAGEWNLNPERVGAYGISAGGCTTLWLATHDDLADPASSDPIARQSTRLQAAAAGSPQTSLVPKVAVEWVGPNVLQHGMIRRAVNVERVEMLDERPDLVAILAEFSPINHVSSDDPPMLLTFPRFDDLPAADASKAIHHANFGVKFKEKADQVEASCLLRIVDRPDAEGIPTPEAFFAEVLNR